MTGRRVRTVFLALVALTGAGLALAVSVVSRPASPAPIRATLSVTGALTGGDDAGFARALGPRRLVFPPDHGPHPAFRTEWWYYTGNLTTADGLRFGFQLTFFRMALTAVPVGGDSAWRTSQVYMAHFALTDTAGRRFHAFERLDRDALGLAGATAEPFHVWVDDWSAAAPGPAASPVRLRAADGDVAIDLVLRSQKGIVLEGEEGLSRKGPEPGNASYYYSLTRLAARGVVTVGGHAHQVSGSSWMDREWSTSALGPDGVGWDWFALQLADGRDLMFYRLRRRDGSADPFSAGTLVLADGSTRPLQRDDVELEALGSWRSGGTGVVYPSGWRIRIPHARIELDLSPILPDQELDLGVRYWEGAVDVSGSGAGQPIAGVGYVELTGYGAAR
jgi:predicted secreted hydrolase